MRHGGSYLSEQVAGCHLLLPGAHGAHLLSGRRTVRSGPALPFFPLPLVDIADRIHSLLNTLLKPFRCPPDRSSDVLLIAQQTFCRRPPAGIVRRHRRKRRGQQCKGNAFHPTFKIPGQILSTKYRQSPPRRRSARQRGSPAGTKSCGIGLPTARNPERRRLNTPKFRRSRSSGGPQRDIPGPQHTGTARHKGLGAPEPRGTETARLKGARSTRGSEHWGHSEDAPSPHASRRQRAFASQ